MSDRQPFDNGERVTKQHENHRSEESPVASWAMLRFDPSMSNLDPTRQKRYPVRRAGRGGRP